jgi:hypothetical protein
MNAAGDAVLSSSETHLVALCRRVSPVNPGREKFTAEKF